MGKEINQPLSDEYGKLKGREKLHLPLHSIYQSNLCHNHSACFHTYSVLNKINLSNPVIAFFVRIFKKKKKKKRMLESDSIRGEAGSSPLEIAHCSEVRVKSRSSHTFNSQRPAKSWELDGWRRT